MFENALQGLAFVISPVSALANLLKNDVLKLFHARTGNSRLISLKAPSLVDDVNEVGITLCREHSIQISIVADEAFLTDFTIHGFFAYVVSEILVDNVGVLFAGQDTGVVLCIVVINQPVYAKFGLAIAEVLEGVLDDCEAVIGHIIL